MTSIAENIRVIKRVYMTKSVSHGGHESIPEHISNTAKDCQRWSGNIKDVQ